MRLSLLSASRFIFLTEVFDARDTFVLVLDMSPMSLAACGFSVIISPTGNGVSPVVTLAGVFAILPAFSFVFFASAVRCSEGAFGFAALWAAAVNVAFPRDASGPGERGRKSAAGGPFVGFIAYLVRSSIMLFARGNVFPAERLG